ncbi:MAG TPA: alpha/beta fold hydrolase [Polyangiaceae bacterium]|nr:alpha/beta fold hydrolase [Polyangiaceae bacterium]
MALPVYEMELHGHTFSYRMAGSGPTLVLLHGITCTSETWEEVIPALAKHFTVIAPDLLGHGQSAKPATEYSPGAYAALVRDLLIGLEQTRVTLVGHSFGGGIAMQFSYLFPEMIERLVLVSSGGLGRELHGLLRMAAVPGADVALGWLSSLGLHGLAERGARLLGRTGLRPSTDVREVWRGFGTFADVETRQAFFHTMRTVVDPGGQRATAADRLYLAAHMPTLIVWGERDTIIPVAHAEAAHGAIDGSRLEVFAQTGHFPYIDSPFRFVSVITDFVASTKPARVDAMTVADELRERSTPRPKLHAA